MLSSVRMALALVFLAFPFLEIVILIKAGETIGFWPTIGLLIAAAVLGFVLIRQQGVSMVGRMFGAMNQGKLPFEPLLDAYALILAGLLFIFPGFLSDMMGLLLLLPPVRHWAIGRILSSLAPRQVDPDVEHPHKPHKQRGNVIIEGTYQRLDDDNGTSGPQR